MSHALDSLDTLWYNVERKEVVPSLRDAVSFLEISITPGRDPWYNNST